MLSGLRAPELLIILVVVLLLFGAKKLPGLARSIGTSAKEFRKGVEEGMVDGDGKEGSNDAEQGSPPASSDS